MKIEVSARPFFALEEYNDHEGEIWQTFLPVEGNEPFIEWFTANNSDEFFSLNYVDEPVEEYKVDILEEYSPGGYGAAFSKADAVLDVEKLDKKFRESLIPWDDDGEIYVPDKDEVWRDLFYKGQFYRFYRGAEDVDAASSNEDDDLWPGDEEVG